MTTNEPDHLLTDVGAWDISGPPTGADVSAGNVTPLRAYTGRFRNAINDARINRTTARREGTR